MAAPFATRVLAALLGALLVVAALVFTASLAVAALLLGAVALVAGALRAARPRVFRARRPVEVIDVEAREVRDAAPAIEGSREAERRSDAGA